MLTIARNKNLCFNSTLQVLPLLGAELTTPSLLQGSCLIRTAATYCQVHDAPLPRRHNDRFRKDALARNRSHDISTLYD